ncbi:MAG: methionyl-tRNA formyltransferase [Dehalococcoidia bacterium]|nr:methionyl-tRNA formyltransferase [Dehalococcoidia bacterium]
MRIVFMGTPEIAVPSLEALVRANFDIIAVYSRPDKPAGRGRAVIQSPVKQAALKHGLPVLQPASLRDQQEIERLRQMAPDLIVVAAFGLILPKTVLDIPAHKCLNLHPSLLPRYRGPSPIAYAILNGDEETGVTIMIVTPKVDAGPVLAQVTITINPEESTGALQLRLARAGAELLVNTIPRWIRGEITPRPQDEAMVTLSGMVAKEDGIIDWSQSAVALSRRVRAFNPWPGTQTRWRGRVVKIIEADPVGNCQDLKPGQVVLVDRAETGFTLGVHTGDGILRIEKVQLEGRKAISGEKFLRGQRAIVGENLPS